MPEEFSIRTLMKLQVVLQTPGVGQGSPMARPQRAAAGSTVTTTGGRSCVVAESVRPGPESLPCGVVTVGTTVMDLVCE